MQNLNLLVRKGKLGPLHRLINRRKWDFTNPESFKSWLRGHLKTSTTVKPASTQLETLLLAPHEHFVATLKSFGINVSAPKKEPTQVKRDHIALLKEVVSPPKGKWDSDKFRKWLRSCTLYSKGASFKPPKQITKEPEVEWGLQQQYDDYKAKKDAQDYIHRAQTLARQDHIELEKFRQNANAYGIPYLKALAALKGIELTESPPTPVKLSTSVANALKKELQASRSPLNDSTRIRTFISTLRDVYDPHFTKFLQTC